MHHCLSCTAILLSLHAFVACSSDAAAPSGTPAEPSSDAGTNAEGATNDASSVPSDATAATDSAQTSPIDAGPGTWVGGQKLTVPVTVAASIDLMSLGATDDDGVVVTGYRAGARLQEVPDTCGDLTSQSNFIVQTCAFVVRYASNGARAWSLMLGSPFGTISLRTAYTAPDGTTFVVIAEPTDATQATYATSVKAIGPTGTVLWSTPSVALQGSIAQSIAVNANDVAVFSDSSAPALVKFDRSNGAVRWTKTYGAADANRPYGGATVVYAHHWIELDASGNVFTGAPTAGGTGRVLQKFDGANGNFVKVSGSGCTTAFANGNLWLVGTKLYGMSSACDTDFNATGPVVVGSNFINATGYYGVDFAIVKKSDLTTGVQAWTATGATANESIVSASPNGVVFKAGVGSTAAPTITAFASVQRISSAGVVE